MKNDLPLRGLSPAATAPGRTMSDSQPAYILIVDDDADARLLLELTLATSCPHPVKTANDGQQALALILRTPPSLIFLDLMMPRMSGFEVLNALQAIQALRHIPIVVVSAMERHALDAHLLAFPGVRKVLNKAAFGAADVIQLAQTLLPST